MKYKFHYGDKVKILHGFYAGSKGYVSDVTKRPITELISTGGFFSSPVWKIKGIQIDYKVEIPTIKAAKIVWIIEQHLEKA